MQYPLHYILYNPPFFIVDVIPTVEYLAEPSFQPPTARIAFKLAFCCLRAVNLS